jgi:hypothetical protein
LPSPSSGGGQEGLKPVLSPSLQTTLLPCPTTSSRIFDPGQDKLDTHRLASPKRYVYDRYDLRVLGKKMDKDNFLQFNGMARPEEEINTSCTRTINRVPSRQIKLFRPYSIPGAGPRMVGKGLFVCDPPASPHEATGDINW